MVSKVSKVNEASRVKEVSKVSEVKSANITAGFEILRWRDELTATDMFEIRFKIGSEDRSVTMPCSTTDSLQQVVAALRNQGAKLPADRTAAVKLVREFLDTAPEKVGRLAARSGWHGETFLMGLKHIGGSSDDLRLNATVASKAPELAMSRGALAEWKEKVSPAERSSRFVAFAILVALSAPVSRFAQLDEGVIFNLVGEGGSGKTSALFAAQSVVAAPSKMGDWNVSERALFERAAAYSDLPLILDDMERFRPGEGGRVTSLSRVIHILTSGNATSYASMVQENLPNLDWWCWSITSSPRSLRDEFAGKGKSPTKGDVVRWIDIPVPPSSEGGIWDRAPCSADSAKCARASETLKRVSERHRGAAIEPWLRHLVDNKADVETRIRASVERFVTLTCADASGQKRRIARKIGTVYAAGIEAIAAEVIAWADKAVLKTCQTIFQLAWSHAEQGHLAFVAAKSALHLAVSDTSELPVVIGSGEPVFSSEAEIRGYGVTKAGRDALYLRSEFLNAICGAQTASLLSDPAVAAAMRPGHGGKSTQQVSIRVNGVTKRMRMYAFDRPRLVAALSA